MSDTFDINDRQTWDWVTEDVSEEAPGNGNYRLNPVDVRSFYQISDGVPYLHQCPPGTVFKPDAGRCDWPDNCSQSDIYD